MGTHHLPVTPHECLCLANQCYYCGYDTVPSLARSVVVSLRPAPESLLALVACVVCEFTDEASEALYNQTQTIKIGNLPTDDTCIQHHRFLLHGHLEPYIEE